MEPIQFTQEEYLVVVNRALGYLEAAQNREVEPKACLTALEDLFTPYIGVPDNERKWFDSKIVDPLRKFVASVNGDESTFTHINKTQTYDRCLGYCAMLQEDIMSQLKGQYRTARRLSL